MNAKFIASAVGFASTGALVAWAITADRAEQRAQAMAEDFVKMSEALREKTRENIDLRYELNDKVEELENIHAKIDEETGFAEDENSPGEESVELNTGGEIEEVHVERDEEPDPTDEEIAETRTNLQNLISQYTPNERDQEVFVNRAAVIQHTKYDPPFVISHQEYQWSDEGDEYAKITLKYYPKQQVLLDEEEEPIDDVEAYVGWRALNRFGDESDDPDIVYVRNRRLETDFEVERTEDDIPLHVKYAMPKMEFVSQQKAGKLRLSEEDG